jgi:TetR/AcrR family transcriptional regulator, regulator of autoinduction and epiphytic fitness
MTEPVKPRRRYDATRRRQQGAESRRATRAAIVEAAARRFSEHGYVATTIDAIAREAGVAPQTVYAAFGNKREILTALMRSRVAGDEEGTPLEARAWIRAAREQDDPREILRLIARGGTRLYIRASPVWAVMREAAAADPRLAHYWAQAMEERLANARTIVGILPADALKPGLTYDDAAEIFWAVASPAVYELLVEGRGWTPQRFERWIAQALADLLLDARPAATNQRTQPSPGS